MGIRNLAIFNRAFRCKWGWHFAKERGSLWHSVICGKYGEEEGGWHSCEVRGAYGVGVGKAIRMEWNAMVVEWLSFWVMGGG